MFCYFLNTSGLSYSDKSIKISGQVNISNEYIGHHNVFLEAQQSVEHYLNRDGRLHKSELLSLWIDENISFAAKCLITLWWGHPSRFVYDRAYSINNLDRLSNPEMEAAFLYVSACTTQNEAYRGLRSLYEKFEDGGEFCLNGIGITFFTKFFHFYFASHPIIAMPDYLPVIADSHMMDAVYAEMVDNDEEERHHLFKTRVGNKPYASFRTHNGSTADSYIGFANYYNTKVTTLKQEFPDLTPFLLEDILFTKAEKLSTLYIGADSNGLFLPPWVAGRYNEPEQVAIIFNNLIGQSFLFEGISARLVGKILEYDYFEPIKVRELVLDFGCTLGDIIQFFVELSDNKIIVAGHPSDEDILKSRKKIVREKKQFLKQSKGTENLQSIFELVDTDYRDRIEKQGIPSSVSFELTYGCNEMCLHCYNPGSSREECIAKKVASDEMKLIDYKSVLDQLEAMGVPKILFTGGDPFMKKDFIEILRYAHRKKFAISIYTNGQAMFNHQQYYDDVLNCYPHTIGLSLYSVEPEVHEKITRVPGSCKKTMAIAEKFSKDGVGMLLKCPIMRINKDSYRAIYDYAISINAVPEFEVNITSSVEGDNYAVNNLRLTEDEMLVLLKDPIIPLSTERKNISRYMERPLDMGFCGAGIDGMNIKPNGEVSPCIAFTAPCGNVKTQRIEEIWKNSETLKRVRKLTYGDSDRCGRESYCKYCNRCIGQSYTEHGVPENYSTDNCFIAKIREKLSIN